MESNLGPPGKLLSHAEFSTDSAGAATFETLPLTPPRKTGNRSADVPLPTSPFAQSQPQRTFRSLSGSSYSTPTFLSSPLKPPAASAEFKLPGGPNGRPLPIPAIPSKPIRSPYPQTSPFSSASARAGAAFASWPSFTREPPVLQNAPQARADGRNLEPSLTRLLSMERGEEVEADSGEDEALGLDGKRVDVKKRWQRAGRRARMLVALSPILRSGLRPAKKLFLLILLNFLYSAIEFLIGLFSGRIGLVSDSFHLTFGCGVLTFSLYALVRSQKKPDETFTYGYKRLEVLAAFTNALFLFFLSFSLAVEALHAFIQDESEHKHYLIVSAVTNLFVNLLGVWFFRQYARIRVAYRKAEDMNLHAVCLHVLADSIRSAGVILASWLLALGVTNAETLCFLLVSVSVVFMAMPIFKASGGVLLQMSPTAISTSAFSKCLRQVLMHEGVSECSITRFWDMVPGFVVGTMILRVKEGADEQKILRHVHSVYNDLGVSELTVQLNIDR